jgi:hypothetical protein
MSRHHGPNLVMILWVFVTFGESHLEALYFTDDMARGPPPEIHFTHVFRSKMVNFYPPTPVYGLTGDRLTKSDEDPNGIKLSSNTPLINKLRASYGDRVVVRRIGSALNGAG